jgi:hypothetical protein
LAATSFDSVCDAIIADYQDATSDTTTVWERGQLKRAEHSDQQRVVFVRDSGQTGDPTRTSSQINTPITALEENVVAHIYAPDDEAAWTVLKALLRAYDRCLGSAWVDRAAEWTWFTQTEEGAKHENYGTLLRLAAVWRFGLTDAADAVPLTPLNSITHTGSIGLGDFNGEFSNDFRKAGSPEVGC